jgi:2,3-bisphosphoglycerate-independent phosphoglycerate mutase
MNFLFLFMDGIGLGPDTPETNPLATASMPYLNSLLEGRKLVAGVPPLETDRASLLALDPNMNVSGLPQSATGQASLLTGKNVPELVGEHYGPKPNPAVREVLFGGTLFSQLKQSGYQSALLNAYPGQYFDAVDSGKRLYSAIPQAVVFAEIPLKNAKDLYAGEALSADFTGEGWRTHLKREDTPVYPPFEAGQHLARLATGYDLAFFEYWPSDVAGHRQNHQDAISLLEVFDQVLGGLLAAWNDEEGLVLLTSDHGNLEALDTRRHTDNPVPALVIGAPSLRKQFIQNLHTLADVTPAILQFYPTKKGG